jgi:formate dehydrogenase major subunit
MGLTQHRLGVDNVRRLVNLRLMRGDIGKPGACERGEMSR